MTRCRVFLIDDHAVLRQGLRLLIDGQPGMHVVGETDLGRGAVPAIQAAGGADVVVLDISMPDISGPAIASDLCAALPGTRIVVLTRHAEKAYIQQMMHHGANGYVLKAVDPDGLPAEVTALIRGEAALSPTLTACLIAEFRRQADTTTRKEDTTCTHP